MTEWQPSGFQNSGFADQLNIQTPEQVDLRFPVAGMGSRFVAVLVDHLIQLAPYVLLLIFAAVFGGLHTPAPKVVKTSGSEDMDTLTKWVVAVIVFANFVWIWGYFSLFEAFWKGQTPGKRLMKLRVIQDSGRQITLFEAMARNLLRFVDLLPGWYLVGIITMWCNRRNKRLGDMAAGTLVIHEIGVDDRSADALLSGESYFAPSGAAPVETGLAADAVSRLDANDLHVIETFFARALDLDMTTRAKMAHKVAARMAAKMQVPMPEGNPERMLESLAKSMRSLGRRF